MAQFFSVMPVINVKTKNAEDIYFSWKSFRNFYSVAVMLIAFAFTILVTYWSLSEKLDFDRFGNVFSFPFIYFSNLIPHFLQVPVVFYTLNSFARIFFLLLAIKWPSLMQQWQEVESKLPAFETQIGRAALAFRIKMVALVVMLLSIIISTAFYSTMCTKNKVDPFEDYFRMELNQIFVYFEYSPYLAFMGKMLNILSTFMWTYSDLFVIVVSIGLSTQFKKINKRLTVHKGQSMPESYWIEVRSYYHHMCKLCKSIDAAVGPITVISFANNLFFVCVQLVRSISPLPSIAHTAYFWFSLIFLITRTFAVSLYSAELNSESKKPIQAIRSCPDVSWCIEVKRFYSEVSTDTVALSGMRFFHLTRGLVLSIVGTIVTYELVLIQLHHIEQRSDPFIVISQLFGVMPVCGILSDDTRSVRFEWFSVRVIVAIIFTLLNAMEVITVILLAFEEEITLGLAGSLIFYSACLFGSVFFIKMAQEWPRLIRLWRRNEDVFLKLPYKPGKRSLAFELRILNNIVMTMRWTLMDVFIMAASIGIARRFEQIYERLKIARGKLMPESFWIETRTHFLAMTELLQYLDGKVSVLVLVSCSSNLYFICFQLFNSFHEISLLVNKIYFWVALTFVFMRTLVMLFCASSIHDASLKPLRVLRSVPSVAWSNEVQRFTHQVSSEVVALSGKRFFFLTRKLIFAMAGTVATFELVLMDTVEYDAKPANLCNLQSLTDMIKRIKSYFIYNGSFYEAIGSILALAQFFAIMPVRGVRLKSAKDLSFTWRSYRTIYSCVVFVMMALNAVHATFWLFNEEITFIRMVQVIFYVSNAYSMVCFAKLAMNWPELMQSWENVEKNLPLLSKPTRNKGQLARKIKIITTIILLMALFYEAIGSILALAQFFAIMPVRGVRLKSAKDLSFTWRSYRTIYSCVVFVMMALNAVHATFWLFNEEITFIRMVQVIFYVSNAYSMVCFAKLAMNWPELMQSWENVEKNLPLLSKPTRNKGQLAREHLLSTAAIFAKHQTCRSIEDPLKKVIVTQLPHVFVYYRYSVIKGLIAKAINILATFIWSYTDLFLMLISVGLSSLFKQINDSLIFHKNKVMPKSFWAEHRQAYRNLCTLCELVDNDISKITLVSFSNNLYFICVQLLWSINPMPSLVHAFYFWFSFICLVTRTLAVTLYSAEINDQSKEPFKVIRIVPREAWCLEIKRFSNEVTRDIVALSGMKFFFLTRSTVLSVAATIVTYELVLIQFHEEKTTYKINQC
ncbi:Gustatory receptor for sugar taste 64f, partial [Pseudolycoriella hygida]